MKRSKVFALAGIFIVLWLSGSSLVAFLWYHYVVAPAEARVAAFHFRFGILKEDGQNTYGPKNFTIAQETTMIPMGAGNSVYGFQIIPPDDNPYYVQYISRFPYPPKTISTDAYESKIPSSVMRSIKFQMHGGWVEAFGLELGYPIGAQSIEILIDGESVKTINFTVIPPAGDNK